MSEQEPELPPPDIDLPAELEEAARRPPAERSWPRDWMGAFLRALQVLPEEQSAADIAQISLASVKAWKRSDAEFGEAVREAVEFQRAHFQRLIHQWATTGLPVEETREETATDSRGVTTTRRWTTRKTHRSERLAEKWLESWYPERYARRQAVEHSGPGGGPIEMLTVASIDSQIEKLAAELAERAGPVPVPDE